MQGPQASAVAFALSGGEPADPRLRLFADVLQSSPRDHDRRLLAAVEPLEPSRRGLEVAASALAALREAFEAASDEAVTLALVRAMAAANATIDAENQTSPSEERDRRVMVGATAVAVEGTSVTLAQLPPSQALLIQDGITYGLPAMASWSPAYVPDHDETSAEPLGSGNGVAPLLYRSTLTPGDLIVLCDSVLARCLNASDPESPAAPAPNVKTLDDALIWLEDVAARNDLEEVQAACIAVPATHDGPEPYAHLTSNARRPRWLKVANRHRPHPLSAIGGLSSPTAATAGQGLENVKLQVSELSEETAASRDLEAETETEEEAVALGRQSHREMREDVESIQENTSDEADPVQELAVTNADPEGSGKTGPLPAAPIASLPHPPALAPAPWWRGARRPRRYRLGPPRYLVAALVMLVTICGAAGLWHGRVVAGAENDERLSAALATVDSTLTNAAAGRANMDDFNSAAAALNQAAALGAPAAVLVDRRSSLSSYSDAVQGVVRLGGLTRVGGLPQELAGTAEGKASPRLIRANRDLYIVAGGFYRLDLENNGLVPVLTPGSEIGDQVVGSLTNGAWAPGGISVTDGVAVYSLDASDTWSTLSLGAAAAAAESPAPCATLNGAFYLLDDATGQIRRFDSEDDGTGGDVWHAPAASEPLKNARGMVIDGDLHVLLADGRIATLADGAITGINSVGVQPALKDPIAIAGGMDASALWVLDMVNGEPRLSRFDPAAVEARTFQLALPPGSEAFTALGTIQDLAVDEVGHVVYFLTDTAIWRADLPVFVPVD